MLVDRLLDRIFRRRARETNDPIARTQEAYVMYLEAKRAWLLDLEAHTLKRRPDLDFAVRSRFRLQLLYDERTALRLEYLLKQDPASFESVKSLSEVCQRVEESWNDDSVETLTQDRKYQDVEGQINYLRGLENPSISEPLTAVEDTLDYRQALQMLQERMRAIDASLARTLPNPRPERASEKHGRSAASR